MREGPVGLYSWPIKTTKQREENRTSHIRVVTLTDAAKAAIQADLSSEEPTETIISTLQLWYWIGQCLFCSFEKIILISLRLFLKVPEKFLFLKFRQGSCVVLCSVIAGDRLFGLNISCSFFPPSILLCLLALTAGLYSVLTDSKCHSLLLYSFFSATVSSHLPYLSVFSPIHS